MTDIVSPERRSEMMRGIRSKGTSPERAVRSHLHALGLRYRLHAHDLPGSPDIVFRSKKVAIFVHGCYWHRHESCRLAYIPKSRKAFWESKFQANVERDRRVLKELRAMGWTVIVVWECEVRDGAIGWLGPAVVDALRRSASREE